MSPQTRQSTIPFQAKKNVRRPLEQKKTSITDKINCKYAANKLSDSEDDGISVVGTPCTKVSRKDNFQQLLTPASALATLEISSPVSKSPTSNAQESLNTAFDELPCRENELNQLLNFLTTNTANRTAASMYISGLPGTGKTAALTKVIEYKMVAKECQTVFVNCTAVKSSGSIYMRIAESLKIKLVGKTEKASLTAIEKCIISKRAKQKMILLVLDEIDQLESKFQSVLYRIFEWPSKPNSRLLLVGIANAVDLTDRVLPRLQTLPLKPVLLHFRPYTKEQIVTILSHRLSQTKDSICFTPGALELISAKVAGQSGDLRRALDLGRRVLELSKPTPSSAKTPPPEIRKSAQRNLFPDTAIRSSESTPKKEPKPVIEKLNEEINVFSNNSSPRKTPRKLNLAAFDNVPVVSPRKRRFSKSCNEKGKEISDEPVINKTPRKANTDDVVNGTTTVNIISEIRRSPRKMSATPVKNSPAKTINGKSSCPQLICITPVKSLTCQSEDIPISPLKNPTSSDGVLKSAAKTYSIESPRKSLRKQANDISPVKASHALLSPRKSPRKLPFSIKASDVMSVVTQMYGSARNLRTEESAFPLHQKLLVCTLMLILTKGKNKDVTVGKLHEVYSRVCDRRGIGAVDQSGFISLCRQVEMAGGVEVGKGPGRMAKVTLQWDEVEVAHALRDSSLLTAILADTSVLVRK